MQEQTRQAAARGEAAVTPLDELEFVPYIAEDGKISKVDTTGVKASVYAVYDEVRQLSNAVGDTACSQLYTIFGSVVCTGWSRVGCFAGQGLGVVFVARLQDR